MFEFRLFKIKNPRTTFCRAVFAVGESQQNCESHMVVMTIALICANNHLRYASINNIGLFSRLCFSLRQVADVGRDVHFAPRRTVQT